MLTTIREQRSRSRCTMDRACDYGSWSRNTIRRTKSMRCSRLMESHEERRSADWRVLHQCESPELYRAAECNGSAAGDFARIGDASWQGSAGEVHGRVAVGVRHCDLQRMRGKRLKVSMIVVAAAVTAIGLWLAQHVQERHKAAERESVYRTVLAQYTVELRPGMTREQVERYLQTNGKRFKQMCCVANFKSQYVSLDRAGYDDLVKIAEESVPFVCSENNVYLAFEFNPKSQSELRGTNRSDILRRISVFHELEGCM